MNPLLANIIGIAGSILFIGAFAYANKVEQIDKLLFNALNLAGAILLLISLSVHFNLAAVVLEIAWAGIALTGLVKAIRERRE
jgi:predicted membrane protein